ncbi:hypothetical protein CWI37_0949p0020 [Hamiltosporidium tvaerminnensis]|uniref:Uncharacterized protein n=1 Tax=Hamiltosporidium tvaerminnensis TaxID=1176355 RepID=A0A4Q9KZZ7_9MICR|nr:hypothetical protein CWI37_0949p0020 [Hamiltosporidium tvaerminnensis]
MSKEAVKAQGIVVVRVSVRGGGFLVIIRVTSVAIRKCIRFCMEVINKGNLKLYCLEDNTCTGEGVSNSRDILEGVSNSSRIEGVSYINSSMLEGFSYSSMLEGGVSYSSMLEGFSYSSMIEDFSYSSMIEGLLIICSMIEGFSYSRVGILEGVSYTSTIDKRVIVVTSNN